MPMRVIDPLLASRFSPLASLHSLLSTPLNQRGNTMPYVIDATDKPDSAALRAAERPKHMAFLDSNLPQLIAVGAKLRDDGETAWGSLYIIDVDDRAAAEAFIKDDPFSKAGLFGKVEISRWRKGFLDGKKIPPKT